MTKRWARAPGPGRPGQLTREGAPHHDQPQQPPRAEVTASSRSHLPPPLPGRPSHLSLPPPRWPGSRGDRAGGDPAPAAMLPRGNWAPDLSVSHGVTSGALCHLPTVRATSLSGPVKRGFLEKLRTTWGVSSHSLQRGQSQGRRAEHRASGDQSSRRPDVHGNHGGLPPARRSEPVSSSCQEAGKPQPPVWLASQDCSRSGRPAGRLPERV